MPKEIETPGSRTSKAVKILAGTGIAVVVAAGGLAGEYYFDPDIEINTPFIAQQGGKAKLTGYEYSQVKTEVLLMVQDKINNGKNPDLVNLAFIKGVFEKEANACGKVVLDFSEGQHLAVYKWMDNFLTTGECP